MTNFFYTPTHLLKEIAFAITPVLTLLFQASLDQACSLDDWKTANVCPIFKKNDCSNPSNYLPVSLTCVLQITRTDYLLHHRTPTNEQFGFQGGRLCKAQLITVINNFSNLNNGPHTDVVLLELTKPSWCDM